MIARAADGSLRDSLTILDQLSSFSSDISETDVKDLIGITDFNLIAQLASSVIEGKREEILTFTAELAEKGTDIRSFIRELIQFFRDMLVLSILKKPDEMLDLGKEDLSAMQNILRKTSEDHLTLLLSELLRAELDVRNASVPRLAFEMSLLKASFLRDMKPLREVIENLEKYIRLVPDSGEADTEKISSAITHDISSGNRGFEGESSARLSQVQEEEFVSLPAPVSQETPAIASEGQTITDEIRERLSEKWPLHCNQNSHMRASLLMETSSFSP